jgi:serine/threonine-protein kinase HipA
LSFHYAESYLARPEAVSLYGPELPLDDSWFRPTGNLGMPGAIRDAHPDGWGQQVICHLLGVSSALPQDYLLRSESNRFGALDFQASPTDYVPRGTLLELAELLEAAECVDQHSRLPPALRTAALHGTSIGGARPKATFAADGHEWIAKFAQTSDGGFDAVGAEAAAMFLAAKAGIDVAPVRVVESLGKKVLLVQRFDRPRKLCVSGLTILGLDEASFRYGSYPDLVADLEATAARPETIGPELFSRIGFNMAVSNFDDHLRNHAAFWDGEHTALTPAFDIAPQPRSGESGAAAMPYDKAGNREANHSKLASAHAVYGLSRPQARERLSNIRQAVEDGWTEAVDFARIASADAKALRGRQFANPATFR